MSREEMKMDMRVAAVFFLGLSVGICLMLIYQTWRGPHHQVTIRQLPPPEVEYILEYETEQLQHETESEQ